MWKAIRGYEGYYEVSDDGIVRSIDRYVKNHGQYMRKLKGQVMKQTVAQNGYLVVNLRRDRTSNVVCVHRLVAEAFIDNPDNKDTVNHIDGDKLNNNVDNLEWATYSENNVHALRTELRHPRGNRILQYDKDGNFIASFRSACEASRITGIGREAISACLNHYSLSAGSFIWVKELEGVTTIR